MKVNIKNNEIRFQFCSKIKPNCCYFCSEFEFNWNNNIKTSIKVPQSEILNEIGILIPRIALKLDDHPTTTRLFISWASFDELEVEFELL